MSVEEQVAPESTTSTRRFSDRWLAFALVTTVLVVALAAYLAGGLAESLTGSDTQAKTAQIPADGSLVAVVARTPGGASEWSNFARVIGYLSEEIGRPVVARYVTSEDKASEIVRGEQADIAFICAHHYLDLSDEGLIEGVCVPVIAGQAETVMQLVVRADDEEHRTFESLAGCSIAVSDKSSLGGQAFLLWLCRENGVEVQDYFSEVRVGETMHENLEALLAGEVDATVVTTVQLSESDAGKVFPVMSSPALGSPPVVVSAGMDADLKARIVQALLAFEPEGMLPETSSLEGFVDIAQVSYDFEQTLRTQCQMHGHAE